MLAPRAVDLRLDFGEYLIALGGCKLVWVRLGAALNRNQHRLMVGVAPDDVARITIILILDSQHRQTTYSSWNGGMIVTTPPQLHSRGNGLAASRAEPATNV